MQKKRGMNNDSSTKITIEERYDSKDFENEIELSRLYRGVREINHSSKGLSDEVKEDMMALDRMNKTMMNLKNDIKGTNDRIDELRKNKRANIAKCIIFMIFVAALIFHFVGKKKHV